MNAVLSHINNVYLVGIGGIGMSGLARYFKRKGCEVAGYDKTPGPLTRELEAEGISIIYDDDSTLIVPPFDGENAREDTLIIYTPAVPAESEIIRFFREAGYQLHKRSGVLGLLSKDMHTIAVAGTHGKTSTSAMIAHILKHSGHDCSAFIGGIMTNYKSNVLFGRQNTLVAEADEFDRSFLALHPDIAVITSMDADHLDIYGDKSRLEESFSLFAGQLHRSGVLIRKSGLPLSQPALIYALHPGKGIDAAAGNIRIENGDYVFDYDGNVLIENIRMIFPGSHNVENAVAAITAALQLDIAPGRIKLALEAFRGIKRRFEYVIREPELVFIDDYAHHPRELDACINSVRQLYPGRKLTMIFQPHLFSRTRDFADEFAASLGKVDELILLDIYPAREKPIEGVNSSMLLDKIPLKNKRLSSREEIFSHVNRMETDVLVTAGAGDIDRLVTPLKKHLLL
ncbi:UDP-N-acetylmuramate--L-alanine ligase [Anseongella ginsenosidimutans]|uniref:UDP-N-acetylmuramate--L-alanine ligase n=1 Tax=Anseongella ginsenosidimutans TaxID=496056 RepID=A0A4R3KX42_9SPHI|nr:UDP-N-acetylmuramate--L-alanine ligase [Anseongella ginsenosidimutans]TCS90379.1 UDP-N-acetylmuramate--L-alanine ligase [Anseongella ginsenosidimutans]